MRSVILPPKAYMQSGWFHLRVLPELVVVSAVLAWTSLAVTGWEQDDKTVFPSAVAAKGHPDLLLFRRRLRPTMSIYSLRRRMLVPLTGVLGLAVTFGAFATPGLTATSQEEKILYLTAVDNDGKSVTDLTTPDVLIREDNQDREVVSVKRATAPMGIVLLADTTKSAGEGSMMSGTGGGAVGLGTFSPELIRDIRKAIGAFVKDMAAASPETQMELMEFGQAAITVTKMTSTVADLDKGVARLFPKPGAPSVLLEAIIEASKSLSKTKAPRRHIVALNIEPGDEQSRQNIRQLHEELSKSRASLWAVSLQAGTNQNAARGLVLQQLTANTGGRREFIQAESALEAMMKNIVANLSHQYEVIYKRPGGGKVQGVLVGVKRDGLKLYANRIPPQ